MIAVLDPTPIARDVEAEAVGMSATWRPAEKFLWSFLRGVVKL
jgi:hypothetical protein